MPDAPIPDTWPDDLPAILDKIEHTRLTLGVEAARAMWLALGLPDPTSLPPVPEGAAVPSDAEMDAILERELGPVRTAVPKTSFGH